MVTKLWMADHVPIEGPGRPLVKAGEIVTNPEATIPSQARPDIPSLSAVYEMIQKS
jgi:hypothetical protein